MWLGVESLRGGLAEGNRIWIVHCTTVQSKMIDVTPPLLYELRISPKLIRSLRLRSLDKAVDPEVQKEKIAW